MKKIIGILVLLSVVLCAFAVSADEPAEAVTWSVEDGVLTIKGTGKMADYKTETDVPWYEHRSEITEIVVEEGITHIGNMAFYGLKNATKADIAKSVTTVGICAMNYTEGTRTTLGNPAADFQYTLSADSTVVSEGDEFILTVTLSGDFKDVSGVQTAIVYDKNVIARDDKTCFAEEWLSTIDENNLGYISDPLCGTVANNLRIAYISLSGITINEDSPLYTAGKTELVIAKVHCKALKDIKNLDTSIIMIKSSAIALLKDGKAMSANIGENQITALTKLPLPDLTVYTQSNAVAEYAAANGVKFVHETEITEESKTSESDETKAGSIITADGKIIKSDVTPYKAEDGCIMLPLRAIMENLGIAVIWDGETKTIFMATDSEFAAHQLGKTMLFKNEKNTELEHASEAKDERCFVAPEFFLKAFNIEIIWNEETQTATIK